MPELVDFLQDRGFEKVDTPVDGGWSTDGEYTVQVRTEMEQAVDKYVHFVSVYEGGADDFDLDTELLSKASSTSTYRALRKAFDQLEGEDDA